MTNPNPCGSEGAGLPGTADPATLADVLDAELEYLQHHRHPKVAPNETARTLVGLALSGGGIRSATTNLGILQTLSRLDILPMVDYLSTVSGGGYIGACLSSLLSWNGSTRPAGADPCGQFTFSPGQAPEFSTEWGNFPFRAEYLPDPGPPPRRPVGAELVAHLRTHGNFLIARWGVLRRETMRSIGTFLTGIAYNVVMFLITLFAASALYLTAAFWIAPGTHQALSASNAGVPDSAQRSPAAGSCSVTLLPNCTCGDSASGCAIQLRTEQPTPTLWQHLVEKARVLGSVIITPWQKWEVTSWPGSLGAWWSGVPAPLRPVVAGLGIGVAIAVFTMLWMAYSLRGYLVGDPPWGSEPKLGESAEDRFERVVLGRLAGVVFLAVVVFTAVGSRWWAVEGKYQMVWLLAPFAVLAGARFAGFVLGVALWPYFANIWTRQLRSLWGAFQAITIYGIWVTLAFGLLPLAIYAVRDSMGSVSIGSLGGLIVTRLLARRGTEGKRFKLPLPLRNGLLALAVTAVLAGGILLFAAAIVRVTETGTADPAGPAKTALVVTGLILLVAAVVVDLNRLSPHYFYRDRLAETYLRSELPDEGGRLQVYRDAMEMPLCCLHGRSANAPASASGGSWRNPAPYQLISAAINLAASRDLTRKDRKSGYWLFSKLYCGSVHTGFRPTRAYRRAETKLARAVAISGAAASSAVGYQTFFAQAFATVLFNIGLGVWMENPKLPQSLVWREGGVIWPLYLWREVTMNTVETSRLVNLSDGGHTGDNVGIYPLLQRRCKVIIACDAERDPTLTFGSFTEALRHAYVDMGIDVDIDLTLIRPDPVTGLSRSHSAVGRIRYPDRPDQESYLIYIKNSLTGDEPAPVENYKADRPEFPHESTADQFFDDAQFESYRALGVHLTEHTFGRWVMSGWFPLAWKRHAPKPLGGQP